MLRSEPFLASAHLHLRTQLPPWWLNSQCSRTPHNSISLTLQTLHHLDKLAIRFTRCLASAQLKQLPCAVTLQTPSTSWTTPTTTKGTFRVLLLYQACIFIGINSTLQMQATGISSWIWLSITPSRSPALSRAPLLLSPNSWLQKFKHQSTIIIRQLTAISAMGKFWQVALSQIWLTTNGWEVPCSFILYQVWI